MAESANPTGTTLFGRVLPRGQITSLHADPLHLVDDAAAVQYYFDYTKENVPRGQYVPRAAAPEAANFAAVTPAPVTPAPVTPAAVAPAAVAPAAEYYYRVGKKFYHTHRNVELKDCPLDVWVRDELGWSSGKGKKWRWRYSDKNKKEDYRDDDE